MCTHARVLLSHPHLTLYAFFTHPTHNLRTASPPHCSAMVGSASTIGVYQLSRTAYQLSRTAYQLSLPTISPTSDFLTCYTYYTHSLHAPYTHPTRTLHTPHTHPVLDLCAPILTSYYLTHIRLSDILYRLYTLTLYTPYTHCTPSHSSSSQHCGRQCEARPFSHSIVSPTTDFLTAYTHPTHTLHTLSCSSQRQGRQCVQQFTHPAISPTTDFLTPCTHLTHPTHSLHTLHTLCTPYTLFAHSLSCLSQHWDRQCAQQFLHPIISPKFA